MRSTRHALRGALVATIVVAAGASPALAAGYDTPILFSARHMGMGGAAIGYVDDGSALFHNPAGLAGIDRGNIIGHVGMLLGTLKASPADEDQNLRSELTVAPMPLLGGGGRITDWLVIGAGVYPVASAGGSYEYGGITDETTLVFFEASPGVAFNLPGNVRIGLSYRAIYASLDRKQGAAFDMNPTGLGLNASRMGSAHFPAFRLGAQWQPFDFLQLGINFRSIARIELEDTDDPIFVRQERAKVEGTFVLPSQLGFGARGDYGDFGAVLDVQYTFNSQNEDQVFKATNDDGSSFELANVNRWSNNVTLRMGGEYRMSPMTGHTVPLRIGYIFDSQANNGDYPTAFGTPPTSTNTVTVGTGWDGGPWEVNLSGAYRFGGTDVDPEPEAACIACGQAGTYEMDLFGVYLDASYDF